MCTFLIWPKAIRPCLQQASLCRGRSLSLSFTRKVADLSMPAKHSLFKKRCTHLHRAKLDAAEALTLMRQELHLHVERPEFGVGHVQAKSLLSTLHSLFAASLEQAGLPGAFIFRGSVPASPMLKPASSKLCTAAPACACHTCCPLVLVVCVLKHSDVKVESSGLRLLRLHAPGSAEAPAVFDCDQRPGAGHDYHAGTGAAAGALAFQGHT